MLEKLTRAYERTLAWGNGGFGIGHYAEEGEKVPQRFEFEQGAFELTNQNGLYFNWHYKPDDYPEHLERLTRRETTPQELRLAFFASGRGSNVDAILRNINSGNLDARPKIVLSNRDDAEVITVAKKWGLPRIVIKKRTYKKSFDANVLKYLQDFKVNCIVLAGYLPKVSRNFITEFPGHILNIHPSLLPSYGGKGMYGSHVHQAVLDSDEVRSGASVHLVTEDYDDGPILGQRVVDVKESDTIKTLASRVLHAEHILYTNVLRDIQKGKIVL